MIHRYQIIFYFLFFLINYNLYSQKYFQQEVNYKINVRLNDINNELYAFEEIEYINNSPDTLNFLYFHIWPNAYKNTSTAYAKQEFENNNTTFYFSPDSVKGYIDSINFKVNGQTVRWEIDKKNIDICKIYLNEPLISKNKIIITTPFHVKIPNSFSRFGHLKQSYQITQWYPKPAVYDKNGWNAIPYLNQGEFYSEFGSFDVSITLPKNYIVGATGNLNNDEELKWLDSIADITKIKNCFNDKDLDFPKSDSIFKNINYTEKNIHDFAWFADKRYNVLKGEVILPNSDKKVTTWTMFTNYQANTWINSIEYVNDAIYYYSLWNGNYPYNNCTAVEGALSAGGGMEYPTITIIGSASDKFSLENVIMHEVGHNWFYGILGTNERKFPWMDEGINSFYELRYINTKYPKKMLLGGSDFLIIAKLFDLTNYKYINYDYLSYLLNARTNLDQPAGLSSEEYTQINYGTIVYQKNALIFNFLFKYLGQNKFDTIMHKFYDEWKFKHPYPEDLQKIFIENANINLDWFFNDLIKTNKKIDYKICKVKKSLDPMSWTGNRQEIKIKNKGRVASPFSISAIKNDSIISTNWFEGFKGKETINTYFIDYDKIKIDANEDIPEINRKNNTIKNYGLLKKSKPLRLQFFGSIENPDKYQIFFLPAFGWNNYNKAMTGLLFYNDLYPQKKFNYFIMPFYAFGNNNFAGTGKIGYCFYPFQTFIQSIDISILAQQYAIEQKKNGDFQKNKTEINILLKKQKARSKIDNRIIVNAIAATDIIDKILYNMDNYNIFYNFIYLFKNNKKINPYSIVINFQNNKNYTKGWLEAKYKISYNSLKKGFDLRLFFGKFIYNNNHFGLSNFRLTGISGFQDYAYENAFLGRTESYYYEKFLSRQFVNSDGGFAIYAPLQSNDWMLALNLKTSIPWKVPIKIYGNFGTYKGAGKDWSGSKLIPFEFGFEFHIISDIFVIYFPAYMSEDLKNINDLYTNNYFEKIRFSLNINLLNPFIYLKNISSI